jgi:hypothetical protein
MLIAAAIAFVISIVVIRRVLPIACAAAAGWLAWSATHDAATAGAASIAALVVASWLLDAAANNNTARRLTVGAEIAAAAIGGGGLAFQIVGEHASNVAWIVGGASIAAIAVVARWRQLAF